MVMPPQMTANLGVLLVGCGVVGDVHANALAELASTQQAHLAAVVDINYEAAAAFAGRWQVPAYASLEEALLSVDAPIVHVCVPSGLHGVLGEQAARAGRHVLVEKPIDVTLEAADRLIRTCAEHRVTLGVVSQHRFDPGFTALQALIRDGRLGRLILGEARVKWYRGQEYYQSAPWRGTFELDGGGALINQSIHYLDLLLALCGPVARVSAYTATAAHELEVEDVAAAVLQFTNGATGTILGSTAVFPGLPERLEISGTDGTAILEDGELVYRALRDEVGPIGEHGLPWQGLSAATSHSVLHHAPPYGGRHTDQIADFAHAVRHGRQPTVTAQDGRKALSLVLAIYQSAAQHREVPVQPSTT